MKTTVVHLILAYRDGAHRTGVVELWQTAFGYEAAHNSPGLVIDKKLEANDGLFFVALAGKSVTGTILAGYDGHRGWLYSVAVHPQHRKLGIGKALVCHAEQSLSERGCMKINLQILPSNASVGAFYGSLGYVVEDRVSMGKLFAKNIPSRP